MKTLLRSLCITAIVTIMGAATIMAEENEAASTVAPEYGYSSDRVTCVNANTVIPIIVAEKSSPCPGKVYCGYPGGPFGEYCCEWGYFYSNNCDGKCYRTSDDAGKGAKCSSYFRCN